MVDSTAPLYSFPPTIPCACPPVARHNAQLVGPLSFVAFPVLLGLICGSMSIHVAGCVVYPASQVVEPGVIKHIEGNRFPLGELDGASTERVTQLSEVLVRAGFKSPVLEDIRYMSAT